MLGAAGGIGQPLSLLLKMNRLVTELSLYDIANVAGVAADLSHCNTPTQASRSSVPTCLADLPDAMTMPPAPLLQTCCMASMEGGSTRS